jgi:hypothetical protein
MSLRASTWGRAHEQALVFATFALLGAFLVVKGAVRLF